MQTSSLLLRLLAALLLSSTLAHSALAGPKNATILLIRHAEKSLVDKELTPAGEAHAKAYVAYFQNYKVHGEPLKLAAIYATADSKKSHRTRSTVEPLAQALGLTVNTTYLNADFAAMAADLEARRAGESVLVCWHHGKVPELLRTLGADPEKLLPGGQWPAEQYDWVIELHYDADGKLQDAQRVVEGI